MKTASSRIAVTEALLELAEKDPNILLVCSDSILILKGQPFVDKYPERYIDVGIAEQCAVGCAAGLASCGFTPFYASYAGFITMRACEQLRTFVAYTGLNVKLIGANGGIASGEREGVTHQFFEDLGILRSIPGITIIVPADAAQVKEAVKAAAYYDGPVYIRIGSGRDPVAFENSPGFEIGKARIIRESGRDVAIFACGFIYPWVFQACDELEKIGIKATLVDVHTLKPLDRKTISGVLRDCGAAVTVEDHNIIGGLGSAITELAADEIPVPVVRVGLRDVFPRSGTPEALIEHYQMGAAHIAAAAGKAVEKKMRLSKGNGS